MANQVWIPNQNSTVVVNFDDIWMFAVGQEFADDGAELETWGVRALIRHSTSPSRDGDAGSTWVPLNGGYETAEEAREAMLEIVGASVSASFDPEQLKAENQAGFGEPVKLNRAQRRKLQTVELGEGLITP